MDPIYLDYQATTPTDPDVLEAMLPWFGTPANPHAMHSTGHRADRALTEARENIAAAVGARPEDVLLTSGSTESANTVIAALSDKRFLVSAIEHSSVSEPAGRLAGSVRILPTGSDGIIDLDTVTELSAGCDAAFIMSVNNEIGAVQPVEDIGSVLEEAGCAFMSDITQAVGKVPVDVQKSSMSAAWFSSHKIYGPTGIGALVWRSDIKLRPLILGGDQQRGRRGGTIPLALAVGFGEACRIAVERLDADAQHARECADTFLDAIGAVFPDFRLNGSADQRVPHNLNLHLPGIDAEELLAATPGVAASTGSACHARSLAPSHVVTHIEDERIARESIRIGFGRTSSIAEVAAAASMLGEKACAMASRARAA